MFHVTQQKFLASSAGYSLSVSAKVVGKLICYLSKVAS